MRRLILVALLAWGLTAPAAAEGPDVTVLNRIAPSVVRIVAEGCAGSEPARTGSGFVWGSLRQVVTDLHVVIGCRTIRVGYQGIDELSARIANVYVKADLVLLDVDRPPAAVGGLDLAGDVPSVGATVDAFGYPLGLPERDTKELHISYATAGSPELRQGLPAEVLTALQNQGFPALDIDVLHLDGNLLPGHSGAPLIDDAGHVVGVGSGGLARGTVGIGWAVRAQYVSQLPDHHDPLPTGTQEAAASFAYAVPAAAADTVRCGGLTLVRTRTVDLAELASGSDDPDRLEPLARALTASSVSALRAIRFAIWTETTSGAAIAVPAGLAIAPTTEGCGVQLPPPNLRLVIRISPLAGAVASLPWDLARNRLQWESFLAIDRQIGSGITYRGYGLTDGAHLVNGAEVLRRIGEGHGKNGENIRMFRADLAGRGAYIMIAAIDTAAQPPERMGTEERAAWASALFAVQLSSFPPLPGEPANGSKPFPRTFELTSCGDLGLSLLHSTTLDALAKGETDAPAAPDGADAAVGLWVNPGWGFALPLPAGMAPAASDTACVMRWREHSRVRFVVRSVTRSAAMTRARRSGNDKATWAAALETEQSGFVRQLATLADTAWREPAPEVRLRRQTWQLTSANGSRAIVIRIHGLEYALFFAALLEPDAYPRVRRLADQTIAATGGGLP